MDRVSWEKSPFHPPENLVILIKQGTIWVGYDIKILPM